MQLLLRWDVPGSVKSREFVGERLGLPSDDQKINHDEPTLPSLRYIPLFDGD
jgi:hypothetical protein